MVSHAPNSATRPPVLVQVDGSPEDNRQFGFMARLRDDERPSLGDLFIVADEAGMCSLHEVVGITRPRGVRMVSIGPQIEWPQGGMELRDLEAYRR